jgi:hypothetical protein
VDLDRLRGVLEHDAHAGGVFVNGGSGGTPRP